MPIPIVASTLVFLALCVAYDWRRGQIPNVLSAAAALIGIGLNSYLFGMSGLLQSFSGLAVNVALLIAPFALGGIGGGDVKMMGAVGAILGARLALAALACGLMLGGVFMVVHLLKLGRLREKLGAIQRMLSVTLRTGSAAPLAVSDMAPDAVSLPYSIPLASGTIVVVLWRCGIGFWL